MNKLKNYLIIPTVFSMALVFALANQAFGQITDDTKNTEANKTSNAANPKTVDAQQSGAWTVGIDPSKNTVQLANTPTNPLSVKVENAPTRKPFQRRISVAPAGNGFSSAFLQIPAGKRLVIENVSVIARIPEGLRAEVNYFTYMDNGDGIADITFHRFALTEQGTFDGTQIFASSNKVLVFADQQIGTNQYGVTVQARLNAATTQFTQVQFTFSGYLEDLPTQ
jgi:hypothetical protein